VFLLFHTATIIIYISLMLRIQQALVHGNSMLHLSTRAQLGIVLVLASFSFYAVTAFFLSTEEPENRIEIIERHNVSWLEQYSRHVIVFGVDIGDGGTFRAAMIKLAAFVVVMYLIMGLLIFLIIRGLKAHAKFESAQKRLCRTCKAYTIELLVVALLYTIPSLIDIIFHICPPLFIPDILFFISRILVLVCFTIQSTTSALIFLSHHKFVKELRRKLAIYFSHARNSLLILNDV
ncbi:hypothetical protein PENTCL1PPCAC_12617, partial [Pristionchus entomophagus]